MENDQQKLLFLRLYSLFYFIEQTFSDVEFTILIQRKGVRSFNIQSEIVKDSGHYLILLSNCKIICSDYFLDYIAATLKSL